MTTYKKFNGVFFWPFDNEENDLKRAPLGSLIKELSEFNFPDRITLLELLGKFNSNRIKLIHKLLDEPPDGILIAKLLEDFDNIFLRYRSIQTEMLSNWPS